MMREAFLNGRRRMRVVCVVATLVIGVCTVFGCDCCFAADEQPMVEVVRERYPDGKVKIERDVTVDADGNYVNHGAWRMWDDSGRLVAEGQFAMGRRSGQWSRSWSRGE